MPRPKVDLDKDTEARLQAVRKELWWGGLQGLIFGTAVGLAGHTFLPKLVPSLSRKLNRNTLLATVLITGSIGSFIGAVTHGKNAVQYIGDIFKRNSTPTSTYRSQLNQNEKTIMDSFDEAYQNRKDAINKAMQNKNEKG